MCGHVEGRQRAVESADEIGRRLGEHRGRRDLLRAPSSQPLEIAEPVLELRAREATSGAIKALLSTQRIEVVARRRAQPVDARGELPLDFRGERADLLVDLLFDVGSNARDLGVVQALGPLPEVL